MGSMVSLILHVWFSWGPVIYWKNLECGSRPVLCFSQRRVNGNYFLIFFFIFVQFFTFYWPSCCALSSHAQLKTPGDPIITRPYINNPLGLGLAHGTSCENTLGPFSPVLTKICTSCIVQLVAHLAFWDCGQVKSGFSVPYSPGFSVWQQSQLVSVLIVNTDNVY